MINGFYKYSLTLLVVLSTSSLALAANAAPSLGAAPSTPTTGPATPSGASPQQNQTDQTNFRNIDAARRHQRDLAIAELEKAKAEVKGKLQKELTLLETDKKERRKISTGIPEKFVQTVRAQCEKMGLDPQRIEAFINKHYPTLVADPVEGGPVNLSDASDPDKLEPLLNQLEKRPPSAASLIADVSGAAKSLPDEKAKENGGTAAAAAVPSIVEVKTRDAKQLKAFEDSLLASFKKKLVENNSSAPATAPQIVGIINGYFRDRVPASSPDQAPASPGSFHESTPPTSEAQ
jgi:hypothetical protein